MKYTIWKNPRLKKLIFIVLIIEISYVVVFNLALRLPGTQVFINQIKSEKFHVSWESASTWYPFRFHFRGAKGHGQSRTQQWEFEADYVSASIDPLPLIFKRVWIGGVRLGDANYQQRPRLKPDKDYSDLLAYYPGITGYEVSPADTTPKKRKGPWHVDIEDIELDGKYSYWIHQLRGQATGSLEAGLEVVSRGGTFLLDVSDSDLRFGTHDLKGEIEIFREAEIKGSLGFSPFVPRENRGIKLLKFLSMDADLVIDVNSLEFLNPFTQGFNALSVDGNGALDGHLNMKAGRVLEGTRLLINGDNIDIGLLSHHIQGAGTIDIAMNDETGGLLNLDIKYNDLQVKNDRDAEVLLTGQGLNLNLRANGVLFHDENELDEIREMSLQIGDFSVPDLALFQRYLPDKWPLRFYGGNGDLSGRVQIATDSAEVDLHLTSQNADLGNARHRFSSNLDMALKAHNTALATEPTTISGSYIKFTDAALLRNTETDSVPWQADFNILKGKISILGTQDKEDIVDTIDIFRMLSDSDAKQLLGNLDGALEMQSNVSSLAWIGVLMNERFRSRTSGSGQINALVNLDSGMPAEGTHVEVRSDSMVMTILDYIVSGDGTVVFEVEQGGEAPDWLLQLDIRDGELKSPGELTAQVRNVDMKLRALIENMSFEEENKQFELDFKIPAARVDDMSTFNHYLPSDSPFAFSSGTADLSVDLLLKHDDADGFVKLNAENIEALVGDQSISGDLLANILLVGGVPADMNFDISGSEISVDNIRVMGENESFNQQNWSALLRLTRANTTWERPISLKTEAELSMTDSRPIVAVLGNENDSPQWVKNMLTVEDVQGIVNLDVADNQIVIPYAFMDSDNIDFGAKGTIDKKFNDGVIYARYKKLGIVLKVTEGKKNFDLIRARGKFDEFTVKAVKE